MKDVRMKGFSKRHDLEEVLGILKERIKILDVITVPFNNSLGFSLAENIISDRNVPAFDRSAMDGYAVMARDTFGVSSNNPATLRVIGEIIAGKNKELKIKKNECARIMTGAPLPRNADAVLMAEYAEEKSGEVKIFSSVSPGKNVGLTGEDIRKGEAMLRIGHKIRPQDIGMLASLQKLKIKVHKKPSVAIIITGDEIIGPYEKQGKKTIDTNSYILKALLEKNNCSVSFKGIIKDDEKIIKKTIEDCKEDIILITGGTSVGKKDFVPKVIKELGELVVHGVNIRPGSPMGVGFIKEKPVFLLPGNPVAAAICYDSIIYQTLQMMQNSRITFPYQKTYGKLTGKITSQIGRKDFVRVILEKDNVTPIRISGAGILSTLVRANGYVIVDKNIEGYEAGEKVEVYYFG